MCLKIDAKYPVHLWGMAGWLSLWGVGGLCFGRFSFGCEIVASLASYRKFLRGVSVLQLEINYGAGGALFRVLVVLLL